MATPTFQSDLSTVRVLIVEPSPVARGIFKQALEDQGCEVLFADDGFDALSKIDDLRPSLVFCASQAPRLDGYRLAHIIKGNKAHAKLHFVLTSHNPDMFDLARGRLMGANEHIVGTVDGRVLQEALDRFYETI